MKRRDAVRTIAAATGSVWVAPSIRSGTVYATETCTPKCAPIAGVTVSGVAKAEACTDGPPGQQNVLARILSASVEAGGCGCGGDDVVSQIDIPPGGLYEVRPKPGSVDETEFDTGTFSITCFDRQGRPVVVVCDGVATAGIKPGSCEGVKGREFPWTVTPVCGGATCS